MKRCKKCKELKPLEDFHVKKVAPDGRRSRCKSCTNDDILQWRIDNPMNLTLNNARARARNKGLPFELTLEDLGEYPKTCPLLGIPMYREPAVANQGCRGSTPHAPSLDRIIPELGYVKGNVWFISQKANTIKQDATLAELKTLVYNLEKNLKKMGKLDEDASIGHRDESGPQQDLAFGDERD